MKLKTLIMLPAFVCCIVSPGLAKNKIPEDILYVMPEHQQVQKLKTRKYEGIIKFEGSTVTLNKRTVQMVTIKLDKEKYGLNEHSFHPSLIDRLEIPAKPRAIVHIDLEPPGAQRTYKGFNQIEGVMEKWYENEQLNGVGLAVDEKKYGQSSFWIPDRLIKRIVKKGTAPAKTLVPHLADGAYTWVNKGQRGPANRKPNLLSQIEQIKEGSLVILSLKEPLNGSKQIQGRTISRRDHNVCIKGIDGEKYYIDLGAVEAIKEVSGVSVEGNEDTIFTLKKPVLSFSTSYGDIEVELYAEQAPQTVANFIRYVQAGYYEDATFFRTLRSDNQPKVPVKISVIQAQAHLTSAAQVFPPIPLERTSDTGLKHVDGTLSMARLEPDTATHHFFVCIGDQPELDYGGKCHPDGQGFAAFAKVIKGMDSIHRIHQLPAEEQEIRPPVKLQHVTRLR